MKFWASTAFTPPSHYIPLAKAADEAGIDGILMSDHIFFPRNLQSPYPYSPYEDRRPVWDAETPWPDVWVTVGAMAAVTTRIQFGSSIYIAPARDLFTVVLDPSARPEDTQGLDHLVQPLSPVGKGLAGLVELLLHPAHADPEVDPVAR